MKADKIVYFLDEFSFRIRKKTFIVLDNATVHRFILENLDAENKFILSGNITAKHDTKDKTIFFSMPSMLNKEDEVIIKNYKEFLEKNGYEVVNLSLIHI